MPRRLVWMSLSLILLTHVRTFARSVTHNRRSFLQAEADVESSRHPSRVLVKLKSNAGRGKFITRPVMAGEAVDDAIARLRAMPGKAFVSLRTRTHTTQPTRRVFPPIQTSSLPNPIGASRAPSPPPTTPPFLPNGPSPTPRPTWHGTSPEDLQPSESVSWTAAWISITPIWRARWIPCTARVRTRFSQGAMRWTITVTERTLLESSALLPIMARVFPV